MTLASADPAGVVRFFGVFPTPDGRSYVFTYGRSPLAALQR